MLSSYLPGSHKPLPSWRCDDTTSWDGNEGIWLGLANAGNGKLECCGRYCLQKPGIHIILTLIPVLVLHLLTMWKHEGL